MLGSVSDSQSEQLFLFLEMWKVFFPGGDPLFAPVALQPIEQQYRIKTVVGSESPDDSRVRLLSRVFCLFSIEETGVDLNSVESFEFPSIDFDIAQFCTLLERYKFTWRTTLQVILFRAFLSGRSGLTNVQKVLKKLCFQKKATSGLTGLLLKTFLTLPSLEDGGFFKEFNFLQRGDIAKIVLHGCQLWVMLRKIHDRASDRAQAEGPSRDEGYLRQQFDQSHEFLIAKVKAHNQSNNNLFRDAVDVLEKAEAPRAKDPQAFSQ